MLRRLVMFLKMKNKGTIPIGNIVGIIMTITVLLTLPYMFYSDYKIKHNDCLIKVAEDYCEKRGEFYHSSYWDLESGFSCKEDIRQVEESRSYTFLKNDLDRCLK